MAKLKLKSPSFTARVSDLVGKPIEAGFKLLPRQVSDKVGEVVSIALLKGLDTAVRSPGSRGAGDDAAEASHFWAAVLVAPCMAHLVL